MKKLFSHAALDWGEVTPVQAYYNCSCTVKNNEEPSWNNKFQDQRTHKDNFSFGSALVNTLFLMYLYLIRNIGVVLVKLVDIGTNKYSTILPGGKEFTIESLVCGVKQNCTAMSSAEAEYVALSASCAQVVSVSGQKLPPLTLVFHNELMEILPVHHQQHCAILDEGIERSKSKLDDEIGSIGKKTWILSDLPPSCKPLGCKWIFKRKIKVDGTINKFKARLVIQGFRQKEGIDYFDTYALVSRITTIRLLLALAAIHNLVIHQMDVKTSFLMVTWKKKCILSNQKDLLCRTAWKAITRVFKYLKGTMNYDLSYVGYPSVLKVYSDASWINHAEDSSSTSRWVFLLGRGAISWASKKQTWNLSYGVDCCW
ncbi:zinc finger, CCHC-type containing protein [Tanacetum coccineum]